MTSSARRRARAKRKAEALAAGTYVPRRVSHYVKAEIIEVRDQQIREAPRTPKRLVLERDWAFRDQKPGPLSLILPR